MQGQCEPPPDLGPSFGALGTIRSGNGGRVCFGDSDHGRFHVCKRASEALFDMADAASVLMILQRCSPRPGRTVAKLKRRSESAAGRPRGNADDECRNSNHPVWAVLVDHKLLLQRRDCSSTRN